jgi:Putative ParB-like nuclease
MKHWGVLALLMVITDTAVYAEYIAYTKIYPGQIRYASANVQDKVNKAINAGIAKPLPLAPGSSQHFTFAYNNGTSMLSEKNALPVIIAPFGYVLVDGHHDLLASISLGAEFIPIKIVGDLSNLKVEEFWKEAEKRGLVYPYAIGGIYTIPPRSFKDLVDEPNRYFAALLARKCEKRGDAIGDSRGAEYPVWIKIEKDIPFIEFMIADVLEKYGIHYVYAMGDNPPAALIEKARSVLRQHPIKGLKLVSRRIKYSDIKDLCTTPVS